MSQWQVEVRHPGLNKYRIVRGRDKYETEQRARTQALIWQEQFERKCAADSRRTNAEGARAVKAFGQQEATRRTAEARQQIEEARSLLTKTLNIDDAISWESLKKYRIFPDREPQLPEPVRLPPKPSVYEPSFTIVQHVLPWLKKRRIQQAATIYNNRVQIWERECERLREREARDQASFDQQMREWRTRKQAFEEEQSAANAAVDAQAKLYSDKDPAAIVGYCEMVLMRSDYPDWITKESSLDYDVDSCTLVVDFLLPNPENIPRIREVRFVASRAELDIKEMKASEIDSLYANIVYQLCLRTCHEIFEADAIDAISSVVFNGFVNYIDKSNGREVRNCIVTLQAQKDEFLALDLVHVDAAKCFKRLKGLGNPALHGVAPVAPILQLNKDDARFVANEEVASKLNEGANLAVIGWEDFEHLIRELFEKEFSSEGGEVRVTRASRDAGVDAIAFDPHPIRGGKIVIQAKRYTNTVDVSAVRDLYGTVLNEGAIKGVLVTTSGFGPDAREFARGKPLTLLDGPNLVHLFQKHGNKVRIDLREAKQLGAGLVRRSV